MAANMEVRSIQFARKEHNYAWRGGSNKKWHRSILSIEIKIFGDYQNFIPLKIPCLTVCFAPTLLQCSLASVFERERDVLAYAVDC